MEEAKLKPTISAFELLRSTAFLRKAFPELKQQEYLRMVVSQHGKLLGEAGIWCLLNQPLIIVRTACKEL